ncbi:monovalent cation/H+ antiporter complex subunit F [Vallicoccus soli]|uniref:Sodium:proton antiporter n=1 Tax=Vallicoccus soli TaxID=2339232 RepID=A0A3A3ZJW0_9ACTN|nr:monovalent cation/H+ antiporter complex subunit F [Vallicoccus soli]RJK96043.1 hypothetical protein D5H78_10805 [Vallicoccus soli]
METVYTVALAGLALAGALVLARLLRGPTTSDRIVALDTLLLVLVGGVAVVVAQSAGPENAGILIVVSLLAFTGTVAVARFLERREEP